MASPLGAWGEGGVWDGLWGGAIWGEHAPKAKRWSIMGQKWVRKICFSKNDPTPFGVHKQVK